MYRKLQQKVREYVIGELCGISDKWKFNIEGDDDPIVVGNSIDGEIIRAKIEEIHNYLTPDLIKSIKTVYDISHINSRSWLGCLLIRQFVKCVFTIYGVNITCQPNIRPYYFAIKDKDSIVTIPSYICGSTSFKTNHVSPFSNELYRFYLMNEQIVPPILLLLDPISYFRQYSIIIPKYSALNNDGHTVGIYELLLKYFPEKNEELATKYFALQCIFHDKCADIIFVVEKMLVELYVC